MANTHTDTRNGAPAYMNTIRFHYVPPEAHVFAKMHGCPLGELFFAENFDKATKAEKDVLYDYDDLFNYLINLSGPRDTGVRKSIQRIMEVLTSGGAPELQEPLVARELVNGVTIYHITTVIPTGYLGSVKGELVNYRRSPECFKLLAHSLRAAHQCCSKEEVAYLAEREMKSYLEILSKVKK